MPPTPPKKPERMSSVDTAWLRMDRPSNLMMICGVLIFGERLTLSRLRATLSDRFLRFKRFRQRAMQTPTGAYWTDDRKFDIAAHVRRVRLRGAAGKFELETLVSDLMATPLDPSKPMWQFHLVEGYEGGSAVVVRVDPGDAVDDRCRPRGASAGAGSASAEAIGIDRWRARRFRRRIQDGDQDGFRPDRKRRRPLARACQGSGICQ